jgi:hypothetical protein
MNNDNYKATDAPLIDPPAPELPPRPRNVNIALALIGAGVVLLVLVVLRDFQAEGFHVESPRRILTPAAWCIFYVVICHQIARGRDWARLVLLILTVASFLQLCWVVGATWRMFPDLWSYYFSAGFLLSRLLPMAMNLAALHLLYFSSGDWFRKQAPP